MKIEMGKRIKSVRETMGMTKESFAKEIGISAQYLGLLEKGKNTLSIDKLKTLCDYTGLTSDYILFGDETSSIISETKKILSKYDEKEIIVGCRMLKNIGLFIKRK